MYRDFYNLANCLKNLLVSRKNINLELLFVAGLIVLGSFNFIYAQNTQETQPDLQKWRTYQPCQSPCLKDTQYLQLAFEICASLKFNNPDSAITITQLALDKLNQLRVVIKKKKVWARFKINLMNEMAVSYQVKGMLPEAQKILYQALKLCEEIKEKKLMSIVNGNLGLIFMDLKDHKKAISFFTKSYQIDSSFQDTLGMAICLSNIGNAYYTQLDADTAENYYKKAYALAVQMKDSNSIQRELGNLGNINYLKGDYAVCLEYYKQAVALAKKLNNVYAQSINMGNVGMVYYQHPDYFKMNKTKCYQLAKQYCLEALSLSKIQGDIFTVKDNEERLIEICRLLNDYEGAFTHQTNFIKIRDSIFNLDNNKKLIEQEVHFNYEKRALADSVIAANRAELMGLQLQKKRNQTYFLVAGLLLVLAFGIFMFNRFRVTQKQKNIIEQKERETNHQKEIIEEKQKEIIDSIIYARRLQQAILVHPDEISKYLNNYFILYKPKDIVAGDFYFFEVANQHVYLAACDCTGHGVPGAMVSLVCSEALTRSVKEFGLTDPGRILDKTRELVLETFKKSGEDVKDGMDISLLAIELKPDVKLGSRKSQSDYVEKSVQDEPFLSLGSGVVCLKWAGANNPLWYMENGVMNEIKADKQPVGKSDWPKPFTTHILPKTTNAFFLFTDGYADQFGGEYGKKFKYKNLQALIMKNMFATTHEMKEQLEYSFVAWKGDLEQVDDVCVIGVKW